MKRCYVLRAVLALVLVLFCLSSVKAQLFYQDSHLFIGPKPTNWASNIQGVLIKQQKGNRYKSTISLGVNWDICFVQIRVGKQVYTHKVASINQ